MSRQLAELETVFKSLIAEHRKLLAQADLHQAAIKSLNLPAMEASRIAQEDLRMHIAGLENRRRAIVQQLAASVRLPTVTMAKIAELFPPQGAKLLGLRDELRGLIFQIQQRTHVAGKVAGAILGHLNTAVRLLASAMHQAGVYTKQGVPRVTSRIGVIEAIG